MVFNSLDYALFFPTVLVVYWRLKHQGQNVLLLGASWLFYALFDWRFLGLMLISTATDYTVGKLLAGDHDDRRRRRLFLVSLAVNLGILGFFKYFNFFEHSAVNALRAAGLHPGTAVLHVVLPVGISFYTFHGISYTFDLYRRRIEPAKDLLTFAVFVAYFPQLVAGPIGRAHVQLPQFEHPRRRPGRDEAASGLGLILLGLFKKVAIADALAPYVNRAFTGAGTAGWRTLVIGAYGFTLQIYGDFSGYSDIARGSSRLLGIELPVNFNQPYLSRNLSEFWQRWHISLSTWLRDYLYVPLGGSRGSAPRTYANLLTTMVLGGLWHGASWTFVAWGAVHGGGLAAHRHGRARRQAAGGHRAGRPGPLGRGDIVPILATFHVVAGAFVLFRSASFSAAVHYSAGMATLRSGPVSGDAVLTLAWAALALTAIDLAQRRATKRDVGSAWPRALRGAGLGALAVAIIVFSGERPVPFIYFQF